MTAEVVVFYLFGGLAVAASFGVATSRNPLHGAAWLLLALFAVAGLFAIAGAHFLAAMQVLVYAGAVVVLFVFVIMLLNLSDEELGRFDIRLGHVAGLVFVMVMLAGVSAVAVGGHARFPDLGRDPGTTKSIGQAMVRGYLLPFEVISLLLLAAMAGAVMLTKRASGAEAITHVDRIRREIDARGSRAFVPDAALPGQQGSPDRQRGPEKEAPAGGLAAVPRGRGLDPGETL